MGFSAKQIQALRRQPNRFHIRTREAHGRELTYLEGWYVISEANRIFGFDGWSRETVESECVLARENRGTYLAVYTARVRLTVQADGAPSSGKAMAPAKAADRHRERCTTSPSRPRKPTPPNGRWRPSASPSVSNSIAAAGRWHPRSPYPCRLWYPYPARRPGAGRCPPWWIPSGRYHPIPRPSRYYGRRQDLITRDRAQGRRELEVRPSAGSSVIVPVSPRLVPGPIDKSLLTIAEPKRLRDKAHLRFVASQPCLVCGRQPSDPHHLRFAQPRALGLKVSDEFTVPLCRGHHHRLHQAGNEITWWQTLKIDALPIARELWEQTHPKSAAEDARPPDEIAAKTVTEN